MAEGEKFLEEGKKIKDGLDEAFGYFDENGLLFNNRWELIIPKVEGNEVKKFAVKSVSLPNIGHELQTERTPSGNVFYTGLEHPGNVSIRVIETNTGSVLKFFDDWRKSISVNGADDKSPEAKFTSKFREKVFELQIDFKTFVKSGTRSIRDIADRENNSAETSILNRVSDIRSQDFGESDSSQSMATSIEEVGKRKEPFYSYVSSINSKQIILDTQAALRTAELIAGVAIRENGVKNVVNKIRAGIDVASGILGFLGIHPSIPLIPPVDVPLAAPFVVQRLLVPDITGLPPKLGQRSSVTESSIDFRVGDIGGENSRSLLQKTSIDDYEEKTVFSIVLSSCRFLSIGGVSLSYEDGAALEYDVELIPEQVYIKAGGN